jgi:hypothetical protein
MDIVSVVIWTSIFCQDLIPTTTTYEFIECFVVKRKNYRRRISGNYKDVPAFCHM